MRALARLWAATFASALPRAGGWALLVGTMTMHLAKRVKGWAMGAVALGWAAATAAWAAEGMWLFNAPPLDAIQSQYGEAPSPAVLERLQKASVRYGASASVVSPQGLVLTNHHVVVDDVQQLSTPERDLLRDGFYAPTLADELPIPGAEASILQEIRDVTSQVQGAVGEGLAPELAEAARRAAMATIEGEATAATGLQARVVTLYQGAVFHLYLSRRYTDVRLVWAPEKAVGFFGGDPDNFEYPRFCLDAALIRLYENGAPAETPVYLPWTKTGATEGALTFVSGHPGRTDRLLTVPELVRLRDVELPDRLERLFRRDSKLTAWAGRDPENARRAEDWLFGIRNGRKATTGFLAALQDPAVMAAKRRADAELELAAANRPEGEQASPLVEIQLIEEELTELATPIDFIVRRQGFQGELFWRAMTLTLAATERAKPSAQRLREYADSRLPSLENFLLADKPIYADLEAFLLADSLGHLAEAYGADSAIVRTALAGQSPTARARALVAGTRLADAAYVRELYNGGADALAAAIQAGDTMLALAQQIEVPYRHFRAREDALTEQRTQAHTRLAALRRAALGTEGYPDATGTLRLSYGHVAGVAADINGGTALPPFTTLAGLWERHTRMSGRPPFALPARWQTPPTDLDLATPFNFISTHDIIGGNSGSPVVSATGELIGLVFDGNLDTLGWAYAYSNTTARSLSVDARAILAALRHVYAAERIVAEIEAAR